MTSCDLLDMGGKKIRRIASEMIKIYNPGLVERGSMRTKRSFSSWPSKN
jgi:hypothetical protein